MQGPVGMQLSLSHPSIPDDFGGCFHPLLSALVSLSHLEEPSQPILITGTAFPVLPSHTLKGDVHSLAKTHTNMSPVLSPVSCPLAVLEAGTALQGNV